MATTTESDGAHECPTCGRGFDSEMGMKVHHSRAHGESIKGRQTECAACGDSIRRLPSRLEERNFCSNGCRGRWRSENMTGEDHPAWKGGGVTLQCEECGDDFTAPKAKSDRKYCSNDCSAEAQRSDAVVLTCGWCGERFKIESYRVESEPAKYCSRVCADKARAEETGPDSNRWVGGPPTATCEWCGDGFEGHPGNANRFCSKGCVSEWRSENIAGEDHPHWREGLETTCEQCEKEFRPGVPSNPSRFCSRDCKHEFQTTPESWSWKGGEFPYGPGWDERKRRRVRIRDQARCQHCGRTEPEHLAMFGTKHHVHHIQKARTFDDPGSRNAMANLVTLCQGECHRTWEQIAPLRPVAD